MTPRNGCVVELVGVDQAIIWTPAMLRLKERAEAELREAIERRPAVFRSRS